MHVLWEGSQLAHHSLALVNREICLQLHDRSEVDLALKHYGPATMKPSEDARIPILTRLLHKDHSTVDVHVRHMWPINLSPPAQGAWVIFQPWEYGALPTSWHDVMRYDADQVWVYSSWNRNAYLDCGIPAEKVKVIPLGIHPTFLTEPKPFKLRTKKTFRFLFVGGTIQRKGVDLLLDAYARAFTSKDDVCLVIKDFGKDSFYQGQTFHQTILQMQNSSGMPEVEYLTEEMSFDQLRDLYHACDCLVHPYRGEGFGLPIAEAMACGLPVIVPDRGGASDFANQDTALVVPSRYVPLPVKLAQATVKKPWWVDMRAKDIAERMRQAYEQEADVARIALAGMQWVRQNLTWSASAEAICSALSTSEPQSPLRENHPSRVQLMLEAAMNAHQEERSHVALRLLSKANQILPSVDSDFSLAAVLAERGEAYQAEGYIQKVRTEINQQEMRDEDLESDLLDLSAAIEVQQEQKRRLSREEDPKVQYVAWAFNTSGYADETRGFLHGLSQLNWNIDLRSLDSEADNAGIDPETMGILKRMAAVKHAHTDLLIQHCPASQARLPLSPRSVLRTMFETDRIGPSWAEICNAHTEVWVPSQFNRESFIRSGVVPEKIRIVPGAIDPTLYDPAKHEPMPLTGTRSYKFLSVFEFSPRKGWDILLEGFLREFEGEKDVSLVLKVINTLDGKNPRALIEQFTKQLGIKRPPHILIIDRKLSREEMIQLYLACDSFVLTTRGEGWGRPYMEAMALGLPTLATRWSAHLEFMNDANSYLIDLAGMESADRQGWDEYQGHLWASPSLESTRHRMREVYEQREEAAQRGQRARAEVIEKFSTAAVAKILDREIRRLTSL